VRFCFATAVTPASPTVDTSVVFAHNSPCCSSFSSIASRRVRFIAPQLLWSLDFSLICLDISPTSSAFCRSWSLLSIGVPNAQLVIEEADVAAYYKGKSVAEQNSVDKSWDLLMLDQFKDLRNAIYCNETELIRFRSLLVNSVMATDIVDKELKQLRNDRWDKAFSGEVPQTEEEVAAAVNRKATIVIEHLIQASDVSHTMQHW
jgi:hypothetical protein